MCTVAVHIAIAIRGVNTFWKVHFSPPSLPSLGAPPFEAGVRGFFPAEFFFEILYARRWALAHSEGFYIDPKYYFDTCKSQWGDMTAKSETAEYWRKIFGIQPNSEITVFGTALVWTQIPLSLRHWVDKEVNSYWGGRL